MSENKKHLSKKIIFPLVLVVVAVVVIGCFFAFRKPKDSQSSAPAVDIVAQYDKESYAAALRLEKCPDYNGNYKFNSVIDVSFDEDYSTQQQNIIFQAINGSRDKNEFISRVGLVIILNHFVNQKNLTMIFETLNQIESDLFYINMAEAWLVCELYVKYPKETTEVLKNHHLSEFTVNKAISKIHDSYRVSKEAKEKVRHLCLVEKKS